MTREEAIEILKANYLDVCFEQLKDAVDVAISALEQPESTRTFIELVVEYPDPELCPYKEYRGKPYYSIKYIENGKRYIGFGTYKPEVLSQYLKEYFIPSAQPETCAYWDGESNFCALHRPSAQPEIIHCEECVYAKENKGALWICAHPDNNAWRIFDDFYCGRAERRGEE